MTLVRLERADDVGLILFDNPPVNALSHGVREELWNALGAVAADPSLRACVLAAEGRTFVAGADIREFGGPPPARSTQTIAQTIEDLPKPVVAALHGTALGGGYELALACHARVIAPDGRVGLPEVKIGLLPGAGGTQRTPRLCGALAALELICSGRHVPAQQALALGLVDAIADDPRSAAIALARRLSQDGWTRTGARPVPPVEPAAFDAAVATATRRTRGQLAPQRAAEAVRAALTLPLAEGLAREHALFADLPASPQSHALRRLFLAERRAARPPHGAQARAIKRPGVVGGGTMGAGIAVALLEAGWPVTLVERDATAQHAADGRIRAVLDRQVTSGRLTEAARDERLHHLTLTTALDALDSADLVIEAVIEEMDAKRAVFHALAERVAPDALLASNTSYLDIDALADGLPAPQRVLGLHFFSPAHVMRLLEVVRAARTAPDVLATALGFARRLGKLPVVAGVCDGFIGNRIYARWRQQCEYLLEDGALPEQVDAAMEAFGFAMGPFAVSDMSGLDIAWAARKRRSATRDPSERYVPVADWLCEAGRFGQKTGAGWYDHAGGKRRPDPAVHALIERASAARGITRRPITAEAMQARVHATIVNEAARILQDGIAARPGDIDLVLVNGYGYPAWRGGPLHEADAIGLPTVLARVEEVASSSGAGWEPAELLRRLVTETRSFTSLGED